mgnify:CR=1 FL=1
MADISRILTRDILPVLSPRLGRLLKIQPPAILEKLTEIRLRVNQPLRLVLGSGDLMLSEHGQPVITSEAAYCCSREDIDGVLQLLCRNSLYAYEQELRNGYITIKGGHRVGLAGQALMEKNELITLKNIGSLNIRLAREVKGCADLILPYVVTGPGQVLSTMIIAPPRCGKTTVLRDLIRQLSNGCPQYNFTGVQVGVVDERSEIAACQEGVPNVDLGRRTDILDACLKAQGMIMFIRAMAPGVLATDELGRPEDAAAVWEAINAGVSVITTVHGRSLAEVRRRPIIGELLSQNCFARYVILGGVPRPAVIEKIMSNDKVLYEKPRGIELCG